MIKIEILSVRNPQWASEDGSAINCRIRTNTLVEEVPFTASKHDLEPHGREIYARCLAGEFGDIAPMEPKSAREPMLQSKLPPEYLLLERFLLEANQENNRKSFRSVVIVWGSLLDNLLDEMLEREALRAAVAGKPVGKPPQTFNGRIERALQVGLIDQDDARKCHHIRCIRNVAAHDWKFSLASTDVLPSFRALYETDHSQTLVFHKDLDFLVQQVYSASCAMLVMRFMRLPQER
ncbi:MAG: hypothetical protein KKE84_13295 [Gammaproteobacteria bacterium]|nr:hypothetical protein [Gammaproteobacteria bacterium]